MDKGAWQATVPGLAKTIRQDLATKQQQQTKNKPQFIDQNNELLNYYFSDTIVFLSKLQPFCLPSIRLFLQPLIFH